MDEAAQQRADEILSLLNITRPKEQSKPAGPAAPAPGASPPQAPTPEAAQDAGHSPVTLESGGFPRNPARIMLTGRSILGVMTFLAQQLEVPVEDLLSGVAHQTLGRDGKPFDWNEISRGMFEVHSSNSRPEHAFLEVQYRGHWFFIDDRDLESKSTYTLLAQLFSLQSASGGMQAPVLTIPTR